MEMIPFQFEDNSVRVIEKDGEPWFVAKDVAELLGYQNTRTAIARHCKSMILLDRPVSGRWEIPPAGLRIIPERDVYRLIMRSKLPSAERFEDWVVSEVLPNIRKTGRYAFNPEDVSKADFAKWFLEADTKVKELEAQAAIDKPKAEVYDQIASATNSMCLRDAAKLLQIKPSELTRWLSCNRWIHKRLSVAQWIAYQDKIQSGYLEHKTFTNYRYQTVSHQVRVTPKGLTKLAEKIHCDNQLVVVPQKSPETVCEVISIDGRG